MWVNNNCLPVFAILFSVVNGNFIDSGSCPSQTVVQDFKLDKFLGKWYQIARYNAVYLRNGKCTFGEFKILNTTEDAMDVHYEQILKDSGEPDTTHGSSALDNPSSGEAKLTQTLKINSFFTVSSPQWILETDYENYAIVYSCSNVIGFLHQTNLMISSRTRQPAESTIADIKKGLEKHKMNYSELIPIDHSNCK